MEFYQEVERSIIKKYRKEIWRPFIKAINEYQLIKDGDHIGICISGGKDSMLMAKLFQELKRHGQNNFDIEFIVMDPGYKEENLQLIKDNAKKLDIPIQIFKSDIFEIVDSVDENPCYLCARMRRGYLYRFAQSLGCNKIALGHHFDDAIETILMSMFYGSEIKTMMPKLHSDNFEGMELIRPLYLVKEAAIIRWRDYHQLKFLLCACRLTETITDTGGGSKRNEMKRLIAAYRKIYPNVDINIFRSIHNINLDTVIGYKKDGIAHSFLDDYDEK
ncbi:tRNA lysidine(34) synthetase [Beduini massiliensis]|uniref:tRNA lysidine(34) synthetase n=1 Tax=Beduini massiliensis TaxID=1585974 RepID=UPI00059A9D5C|nr:ATP-binding protein [Beduini massiliensis]